MTPYFNFYFSASEKSELQKRNHKILHPIQLAYIPKKRKIISFTTPLPINKKYSDYKKLGLYKHFVMLRYRSGYENPTYISSQISKGNVIYFERELERIDLSQEKIRQKWEDEQRIKPFTYANDPELPIYHNSKIYRFIIEDFKP